MARSDTTLFIPQAPVRDVQQAGGLKPRAIAAAAHLAVSAVVAVCVIALVYLAWYRNPLDSVSGVGDILIMLLLVDVTIGPLLTMIVYDRRKRSLPFDLCCIALLQLTALVYGLHVVEEGRPHFLVFVKDRFEVVSKADLRPEDRAAAIHNVAAQPSWLGPKIVAAEMPTDPEVRKELLIESALGGRDVQHFPKQYRDYAGQRSQVVAKAQPLSQLLALNPEKGARVLQDASTRTSLALDQLKFLPIKGPKGDAAMLIDGSSGAIAGMVDLAPWN